MALRRTPGDGGISNSWPNTGYELLRLPERNLTKAESLMSVETRSLHQTTTETSLLPTSYDQEDRLISSDSRNVTLWQRVKNRSWFEFHGLHSKDAHPPHRGWRKAVILAAAATGIVFLVNLALTIVVIKRYPADEKGIGLLYSGDCAFVKRANIALHLLINILSTMLLAASSYTMQCLSSPTRSEVNRAHLKGKSLDIGVPNVKNFRFMRRWKAAVWLLLVLSTLPLHFLWNSTIFSTGASNLFTYVVANEGFLQGQSYDRSVFRTTSLSNCSKLTDPGSMIDSMYKGFQASRYSNLSTTDCFNRYVNGGGSDSRNLILITSNADQRYMSLCGFNGQFWNGSSIMAVGNDIETGSGLANSSLANFPEPKNNTPPFNTTLFWNRTDNALRFGSYPISYCLSESVTTSYCKLQVAPFLLYVVVVCNLIKFICMSVTAASLWNLKEPILATVGDAVASFLDERDDSTAGLCLLDWKMLTKMQNSSESRNLKHHTLHERQQRLYSSKYNRATFQRLSSAASDSRKAWAAQSFNIFWILGMFAVIGATTAPGTSTPFKIKFGAVDKSSLFTMDGSSATGLFTQVLVANLAQVLFSIIYFLYNSMFTVQCGALEWAKYAQREFRTLRVTWPRGEQRSTYFLQLPWRYGIPLTILQVLMHFFISQSIFLARLEYYDSAGKAVDVKLMGFLTVGYSASAIVITWCILTVILFALLLHGFRRVDNRIPLHGNQSTVISAMCHMQTQDVLRDQNGAVIRSDEELLSTRPLMWGVTKMPFDFVEMDEWGHPVSRYILGHCTFTDTSVDLPCQGCHYF